MCFFASFFPATFWVVIGYFVLFSSTRAEGGVARLGRVLAIWVFLIAGVILIAGAYLTITEICPIRELLKCDG